MTVFNISYLSIRMSNFEDDQPLVGKRGRCDLVGAQSGAVGEFDDRIDVR
jgi:hypothetical protein